jgi:hypothetical protein
VSVKAGSAGNVAADRASGASSTTAMDPILTVREPRLAIRVATLASSGFV